MRDDHAVWLLLVRLLGHHKPNLVDLVCGYRSTHQQPFDVTAAAP
jgi:hypothetical protein